WVVVDDVPDEGYPSTEDHLRSAYLLFTSNFDGGLDAYLDAMLDRMPEEVDALWGHCVGYPGVRDRQRFHAYMKRCQLETTFFFPAYPQATLPQVRDALARQRAFVDLFAANQGKPAAEIQRHFVMFAGGAVDPAGAVFAGV